MTRSAKKAPPPKKRDAPREREKIRGWPASLPGRGEPPDIGLGRRAQQDDDRPLRFPANGILIGAAKQSGRRRGRR
jgi:hypothetical protein